MTEFSISNLEDLTGIKAHTLRIWEKRYDLLTPSRTASNIRVYTETDLKKLLNVAILNNYGMRISKIVQLSDDEIQEKVLEVSKSECDHEILIESLLLAMVTIDERRFEQVIGTSIRRFGLEDAMVEVIYPFYHRLGVLWLSGSINPGQEHFISALVRQKLIASTDQINREPHAEAKTFLLFLPENELHELGLLFYNYVIKKAGHHTIYLGQSVPIDDAGSVSAQRSADYILTACLMSQSPKYLNSLLKKMLGCFGQTPVFLINRIDFADVLIRDVRLHINCPPEKFKRDFLLI